MLTLFLVVSSSFLIHRFCSLIKGKLVMPGTFLPRYQVLSFSSCDCMAFPRLLVHLSPCFSFKPRQHWLSMRYRTGDFVLNPLFLPSCSLLFYSPKPNCANVNLHVGLSTSVTSSQSPSLGCLTEVAEDQSFMGKTRIWSPMV